MTSTRRPKTPRKKSAPNSSGALADARKILDSMDDSDIAAALYLEAKNDENSTSDRLKAWGLIMSIRDTQREEARESASRQSAAPIGPGARAKVEAKIRSLAEARARKSGGSDAG